MSMVKPKKSLGQHFLIDLNIARKIVDSLESEVRQVLEIGPGTGVLTRFLLQKPGIDLQVVEIDRESVEYLRTNFPELQNIRNEDFLKADVGNIFEGSFCVIGNFPYNISSQIFFKILSVRNKVPQVVGMVQKEVAERIASKHGSKSYGILSVLLQAFYDIKYLFTVPEHVFLPPPKVKSAVIRLKRNSTEVLPCNETLFTEIVKTAFNQRRKMLRNSIKSISDNVSVEFAEKRPEQLSVNDFIELAKSVEAQMNQ